jgi:hypothetical protein
MAARKLNRRAFLGGATGVAIALPMLEAMLEGRGISFAADPPGAPQRFLVTFGGHSLGSDCDTLHNDYVPNSTGTGYDLKSALAPFADFDVQNEISVISGLLIPYANGGATPAGGRADDFHINSLSPLFSGVRSGGKAVNGPTSDQIVAEAIAGDTTFKSLGFRVQANWYLSVSAPYGRDIMSYKSDGGGGVLEVPPNDSPQAAFDSLFSNFTPTQTPEEAALADFRWRQRKSVLDVVRSRAEVLVQKLGGADKIRLERHFDEIRDLEIRIAALPPVANGACQPPTSSPTDPAPGGAQGTDADGNNTYDTNLGYSGEEERARVFCDLIHLAFACDLTRSVSLMWTMAQSHMNMFQLTGQATDLHEVGHCGVPGGTMAVSTAIAWHMKHFCYLIDKLRSTPEGNGTLLDNTAALYLNEGGHGWDPGGGKDNSAHSTENMACLVAGRAGGLVPGQHIVADGMHPANAIITAMNAVGVQTNTFGEVSGTIPGLIG